MDILFFIIIPIIFCSVIILARCFPQFSYFFKNRKKGKDEIIGIEILDQLLKNTDCMVSNLEMHTYSIKLPRGYNVVSTIEYTTNEPFPMIKDYSTNLEGVILYISKNLSKKIFLKLKELHNQQEEEIKNDIKRDFISDHHLHV